MYVLDSHDSHSVSNERLFQVKLADFGFSTILKYEMTDSFLGTGGYIAPEILQQQPYSQSVDVWASGVLLYVLLSARLPFSASVEVMNSREEVTTPNHSMCAE